MLETIRYFPLSGNSSEDLPSIICLGNFDGVHKGHSALIDAALKIASDLSLAGHKVRVGALCFDTLSSNHFKDSVTPHIISIDKKLGVFKDLGLDCAFICNFVKIKDLSPIEFIEEILIKHCACVGVVCGFNFRFGKKAAGNAELLVDYFNGRSTIGEASHVVPPVMLGDRVISSSCIRELISGGDLYTANKMLGRPFSITHTVVHGKHLGTELGFPTINHVFAEDEVVPAFGIYATKTAVNGESFISVTNVGIRPTVSDSDTVTCETHIIGLVDKNKDFYGKEAEISFYSRLRDEKRFDSPAMLSEAIAADVEAVKDYFYNDNNEK